MNRYQVRSILRRGPLYVHYGITHRCNVGCKMCGIWRYGNKEEELSFPQIQRLADVLKRLGVFHVSIGGGEPFMREDLPEVVHEFIRRGLRVRVLTNGITPDEKMIRNVVDAGLREVSISFDTLYPEKYAYITGDEEAWEKGIRNLHTFASLLPRRNVILIMNSVFSALNFMEFPSLVAFAHLVGYHISLLPVELAEKGDRRNPFLVYNPKFKVNENNFKDIIDVYKRVIEMKRKGYNVLNSTPFLEASIRYFTEEKFPPYCDAGSLYFSINPAGMLTLCHKGKELISILDKGVFEYLKSPEFLLTRKVEIENCEGCIRPCWMDTSSIFHTSSGFAEALSLYLKTTFLSRRPPPPLKTLLGMRRFLGQDDPKGS